MDRLSPRCRVAVVLALAVTTAAAAETAPLPDRPNAVTFAAQPARFVRLVIGDTSGGQACLDELEVYGPDATRNLALARDGAKASASSALAGYAIHQIAHLNDGLYGNSHSWIAAGEGEEWAQIELPAVAPVSKLVFSRDREGKYRDRTPLTYEVRLSVDGQTWTTVARHGLLAALPNPLTWPALERYAFACERSTWQRLSADDHLSPLKVDRPALPDGPPYWSRIARLTPFERVATQMAELAERLAAKGVDVSAERAELAQLRQRQAAEDTDEVYFAVRLAKRRLMFRDPDLAALDRILFVKRHPYLSSHNYSDVLDSQFRPGGGLCVLNLPRVGDRLVPEQGQVTTLFDASAGIARDPAVDFDGRRLYFAYRPQAGAEGQRAYWHLMAIGADGSGLRKLTSGPFHDYYPCPLPDGGLAFISTRCRARFLCWRPQTFVLFRMGADGEDLHPLSYANLSEWSPAVMRDGRIMWTRSEYLDKGADFGHTLWAVRPDGTHPQLVFGNNTPNCYLNGREVPGTREILCTLMSHGGDHNGPLGLVDTAREPFDSSAVTNLTPDVRPHYNMSWPRRECFRDPTPLTRDYFLASHAPADRFGLYLIDRWGNRELLYLDPAIGSMSPVPLRAQPRPPALEKPEVTADTPDSGVLTVIDIYQGLEPGIARGRVKYLRVCQEVRSDLAKLPNGEYAQDTGPAFEDHYATPVHKVRGPFGWPSYVAKASLGIVPVAADGSVSFKAPAGKVLYFEALDADFNELQRMRSVVQLQPGERRSCVGCHEPRLQAPPVRRTIAARQPAKTLTPPPWGAVPFAYEQVVQPVLDAQCVRCHGAGDTRGINLSGTLDGDRVPASYRTLVSGGWVHYFDMTYGLRHSKAAPLSFGVVRSKLWPLLDAGHHGVKLTRDQTHAVKCWVDLNCPLWPDYRERLTRPAKAAVAAAP